MNINLDEISKKIGEQLELLKRISEKDFDDICEFQLGVSQDEIGLDRLHKNDTGIYLFEIKRDINVKYEDWIENFTNKFRGRENDEKFFLHKFTPNVINKRKNNHKTKEGKQELEWIPLYLGKSMDIKKRVLIHIFSELGKPPFALKLNNRLNEDGNIIFSKESFRLKVLRLQNVNPETYNAIVSYLEKLLREKLSPIVGRQ